MAVRAVGRLHILNVVPQAKPIALIKPYAAACHLICRRLHLNHQRTAVGRKKPAQCVSADSAATHFRTDSKMLTIAEIIPLPTCQKTNKFVIVSDKHIDVKLLFRVGKPGKFCHFPSFICRKCRLIKANDISEIFIF